MTAPAGLARDPRRDCSQKFATNFANYTKEIRDRAFLELTHRSDHHRSGASTSRTPSQTWISLDRLKRPSLPPRSARSTVAICVTLTTDGLGSPASPRDSLTFPGSAA